MKAFITFLFLMLSLLSLGGCGAKGKPVSLQVTGGFAIGSEGYTGGLIAYGEGPNNARFAVTTASGKDVSVNLVDGQWKIYVMGWSDSSLKFRGTKYCGLTNVKLGASDANINIVVNETNCSTTSFQEEAQVKSLAISSCGAFYSYAGGSYSPLVQGSPDDFCSSLPKQFSSSSGYFRLVANHIDSVSGNVSSGLATECLPMNIATSRLLLPTNHFPFTVRLYQYQSDCSSLASNFNEFVFKHGIQTGNQASFDNAYFEDASNLGAHLALPDNKTRRGYSPFMNRLPRITCGAGDCFSQPVIPFMSGSATEKVYFDVPWSSDFNSHQDSTPIIKGYASRNISSSCDPNVLSLLNQSNYFSVDNCQIDRGDVKGTFKKNAFNCQASGTLSGMAGVYARNGKIYLVQKYTEGGDDAYKVIIRDGSGNFINELFIPLDASRVFKSINVSDSGAVTVLMGTSDPSNRMLYQFIYNISSQSYSGASPTNAAGLPALVGVEKIEYVNDQLAIFATETSVSVYQTALPYAALTPMNFTDTIQQISYRGGFLWILTTDGTNSKLLKYNVNGTNMTLLSIAKQETGLYYSFDISSMAGNAYVLMTPKMSGYNMKIYSLLANGTVGALAASQTLNMSGENTFASLMLGDKVYRFQGYNAANTALFPHKMNLDLQTIPSTKSPTPDICEAVLTKTIGTRTYALNVSSAHGYKPSKPLFEDAYRYLGAQSFPEFADTYFRSLASDSGDKNKASGTLGRASEMMGPDGIGGVLSGIFPNLDCPAIKTKIPAGGLNTKFMLRDAFENKERTYQLQVKHGQAVEEYLRPNADPLLYDLEILITSPGIEKMRMNLVCDSKIGTLESVENDEGDLYREFLAWNTQDFTNARFERFRIEDQGSDGTRFEMSGFEKFDVEDISMRDIELYRRATTLSARVTELGRTSTNIMTSHRDVAPIPDSDFTTSNSGIYNIIANPSIGDGSTVLASHCMPISNIDPRYNAPDCFQTMSQVFQIQTKNFGIDFTPYSLKIATETPDSDFFKIFSLNLN